MSKEKYIYPTFKVEDDVHAWERFLVQAIPKIAQQYFPANPRFKDLGQITSPSLVDYMGIYEEGDWWALTIIKVNDSIGSPRYLFIPLMADSPAAPGSLMSDRFLPGISTIAFIIETDSQFYGSRSWVVFDALADPTFRYKLLYFFLQKENVANNQVNAYITVNISGLGQFDFHLKDDVRIRMEKIRSSALRITRSGDTLVKYGAYRLVIPQTLATVNTWELETSGGVVGWITYSGPQGTNLVVGILKER
jgi:hypothetical protein